MSVSPGSWLVLLKNRPASLAAYQFAINEIYGEAGMDSGIAGYWCTPLP